MSAPVFLRADWRWLAMLNYEVEPETLADLVPAGTELDFFRGRTYLSVVGFRFLRTRVHGVPIPFHTDFDEVNLRFYVRRKHEGEWRRGVVFVKELVPKRAIAWVARRVYGENYHAVPMRHRIQPPGPDAGGRVQYEWQMGGRWHGLTVGMAGESRSAPEASEARFITEHYWGYAGRDGRRTMEYEVKHPSWRIWEASTAVLDLDVATVYGARFQSALDGTPTSAFVADGSEITVHRGGRLPQTGATADAR